MKVVFLDIDGVLNDHEKHANDYCGIVQDCCGRLNQILEETGAFLVVSSAWRYLVHCGSMTVVGLENLLLTHGVVCRGRVLDVTAPDHDIWDRGDQIASWLRGHTEVERYIVLDDLDLGISRCGHPFIRTNGDFGISETEAGRAIYILNSQTP